MTTTIDPVIYVKYARGVDVHYSDMTDEYSYEETIPGKVEWAKSRRTGSTHLDLRTLGNADTLTIIELTDAKTLDYPRTSYYSVAPDGIVAELADYDAAYSLAHPEVD